MRRAPLRASRRRLRRGTVYDCAISSSVSSFSRVFGGGLDFGGLSASRRPRDELRSGYVEAPAGRAPRGRDGQEGRVLLPAAVLGERAPGAERAAFRRHPLRSSGSLRALTPGPVGTAAQTAAEVVGVRG